MHITGILSLLLMTVVVLHGSTFCVLKLKHSLHSNSFMHIFKLSFHQKLKLCILTTREIYISFVLRVLAGKWYIISKSCPSTPQQNGVVERKNRHLLDVVCTLMLDSFVPSCFWCEEALSTAVHLINRLPSQVLNNDSPFLRLFGKPPNYSTLRTFGCVCYVHLQPLKRTQLTTQSVKCAFLGYSTNQKGVICYDPHLHRIRVSRNVIFQEDTYFFTTNQDTHSSTSKSVLPLFPNSFAEEQARPPFMVYQRCPIVPLIKPSIPPRPPPDHSLAVDSALQLEPVPFRCSTRIRKPTEKYDFS